MSVSGSVQSKSGKLYIVLNFKEKNCKRRTKWIKTGLDEKGNKKKAQKLCRKLIEEYESKMLCFTSSVDVADYCVSWLESKKSSLEMTTYDTYVWQVDHIIRYFSPLKIPLNELAPSDVDAFFTHLANNGNFLRTPNRKPGLSARTVKDIAQRFRSILNKAVLLGYISKNPAENVEIPQPLNPDRYQDADEIFMDLHDISLFFNAIQGEPLERLFKLTLMCGLRREEVCGLKWNRVDFNKRTIEILDTRVRTSQGEYTKPRTKNSTSHRTYPLNKTMYQILLQEKQEQKKNQALLGSVYSNNDGYVFVWPNGTPFSLDYVSSRFKKIIRKTDDLDSRLKFHSLRVSCVSIMASDNIPLKEIQCWVGHKDPEITLRIYNKMKQQQKTDTTLKIDELFKTVS